jgi:hypothetical protein
MLRTSHGARFPSSCHTGCPAARSAGLHRHFLYAQSLNGHLEIVSARQPVDRLIADPAQPERCACGWHWQATYAGSPPTAWPCPTMTAIRSYVDTRRDYVTWAVFAAPEFALGARTWCFPVRRAPAPWRASSRRRGRPPGCRSFSTQNRPPWRPSRSAIALASSRVIFSELPVKTTVSPATGESCAGFSASRMVSCSVSLSTIPILCGSPKEPADGLHHRRADVIERIHLLDRRRIAICNRQRRLCARRPSRHRRAPASWRSALRHGGCRVRRSAVRERWCALRLDCIEQLLRRGLAIAVAVLQRCKPLASSRAFNVKMSAGWLIGSVLSS